MNADGKGEDADSGIKCGSAQWKDIWRRRRWRKCRSTHDWKKYEGADGNMEAETVGRSLENYYLLTKVCT